jgi:hypothetical protein
VKLDFFMLADDASAPDGKVYIHGGAITRAYPPNYPAPFVVTAVTRVLVDPDEIDGPPHPFSVEWFAPRDIAPSGVARTDIIPSKPTTGVREGEDIGIVIVARMAVQLPQPGSYRVRVRLDGEVVCERQFYAAPTDDPTRPSV